MKIEKYAVVSLEYELHVDTGELVDEANAEEPFQFILGINQTLPAFESNLEGKRVGDDFEFSLEIEEAYGVYNPDYVVDIPISVFEEAPGDSLAIFRTIWCRHCLGICNACYTADW